MRRGLMGGYGCKATRIYDMKADEEDGERVFVTGYLVLAWERMG